LKRFLIIQTAFIGDVILATPILEKLHDYFPEAKIDFLLRKGNESLFENHPFINQLLIWEKQYRKYLNFYKIIKQVRQNKYDCVINIQRFSSSGVITILSGSKLKIGFNKNPFSFLFNISIKHKIGDEKSMIHEIDRNLSLIESLTDKKRYVPKLYPSNKDFESSIKYRNKHYICIAPASVWFTKQYPGEKWIEFINLINFDLEIYLIGGKDDISFCNTIINNLNEQKGEPDSLNMKAFNSLVHNLAGKFTFLQTAAIMKEAKMNYVNDSAPMHIASAVNAPVTAVFCSTVPEFGFGPLSDKSMIVQKEGNLYCRPCGLHGFRKCPQKHFKCALDIKNETLLKTLDIDYQ
jgi:ADP-heptose:LPS heptosyltransferase